MQLIRVSPSLDLNGPQLDYAGFCSLKKCLYLANNTAFIVYRGFFTGAATEPGLLRYEMDVADVFVPDGGRNVTDPGLPEQLWPCLLRLTSLFYLPLRLHSLGQETCLSGQVRAIAAARGERTAECLHC